MRSSLDLVTLLHLLVNWLTKHKILIQKRRAVDETEDNFLYKSDPNIRFYCH